MNNLNEEQLNEVAQKRVDFKHHLFIFVTVIAFLWAIWAITDSDYMWPVWPTAGWGIAIFFHYAGVYNPFNLFSVEKEIEKMKKKKQ